MSNTNHSEFFFSDTIEPPLETAVQSVLSEPLPSDALKRVKQRAIALDEAPATQVAIIQPSRMRSPWFSMLALAASVLFIAGLSMLTPTRDAFAQVVENIKKISTAQYVAEETGPQGIVALARVKAPLQLRMDFRDPLQSVSVSNGTTGEMFTYSAASEEVKVNTIDKASTGFDLLQLLTQPDVNAVISQRPNNLVGSQLYDIFEGKGRLWVDRNTHLPVRIEMPSPTQQGTTLRIYRDFEWNVPLDESIFELPRGRKVVRGTNLASPTELELIGAFAIRHAFSQAPYDAMYLAKSNKPGLKLSQMAYDPSQGPDENFRWQSERLRDSWGLLGLSEAESRDAGLVQKRIDYLSMKLDDWASTIAYKGGWLGANVRPGESKPLCWWRSGGRVRVLNADLTIVDASKPPEPTPE